MGQFNVNDIYHETETWAQVEAKLLLWAKEYTLDDFDSVGRALVPQRKIEKKLTPHKKKEYWELKISFLDISVVRGNWRGKINISFSIDKLYPGRVSVYCEPVKKKPSSIRNFFKPIERTLRKSPLIRKLFERRQRNVPLSPGYQIFLPLKDLSLFESKAKAESWVFNNEDFYRPSWDRLIEKAKNNG